MGIIKNNRLDRKEKILLEVADPTHKIITRKTITFTVPESKGMEMHH